MLLCTGIAQAALIDPDAAPADSDNEPLASALTPQAWVQVERSIESALVWLATQQLADGSYAAPANAQPAATSFAIMAYLSKGYRPGEGPYGKQIDRAIDCVLRMQQSNGLLAFAGDASSVGDEIQQQNGRVPISSKSANYNHAISALMLTEVYGTTDRIRAAKLKPAIIKALDFSRRVQIQPKSYPQDKGGLALLEQLGVRRFGSLGHQLGIDVFPLGKKRRVPRAEGVCRRCGGLCASLLGRKPGDLLL
jgi:hypothetical protein